MQPFEELGGLITSRWRDKNFNEDVFPAVAAQALSEFHLTGRIDPWDIIRWVHTTSNLPQQMDLQAKFGDPPITLYAGSRFYIDVYFWLDGTTSIHQHSFSGAFQVLLGSSIHSKYLFEAEHEINPHFLTGKIVLGDVTLLAKGDIREIRPGPQFIHSLFHLERPSATITVRSYKTPSASVQFSYKKPFLAVDPFFTEPSLTRKVQTVELLLRMKHPEADKIIAELVDSSDVHTTFAVLEKAFDFLCHRELEEIFGVSRSCDRFQALLERARSKHGKFADLLAPVFEEDWRQDEITRRRAEIKGEDHRYFLALLLNVPTRKALLRLVKERFPDQEPVDLVVDWVRELSITKIFGSKEPSVLGIEFGDKHLLVFKGLLEGLSVLEIEEQAAAQSSAAATTQSSIPELASQIKSVPLFKSIFEEQ